MKNAATVPAATVPADAAPAAAEINAVRACVLVVDDDVTVRMAMRAALRQTGFEVLLAEGGEQGLRLFNEHSCHMVMLDVDMPDLSGYAVCAQLRALAGDLLPIVMVTGMDDADSVKAAYDSGATDFIVKPINWGLVGHRMRYVLRAREAIAGLRAAHTRNAAVLKAIPDTMFRVDADGRVLDMHGPADDILTTRLSALIAEHLLTAVRRALLLRTVQETDFSLSGEGGERQFFESRVAPIDERQALCLVRDITARKRAETDLLRSQERLEQAQAVARLGSWYANTRARVLEWSTQTYRICGVPEGTQVDGEMFLAMVHPDDLAGLRRSRGLGFNGKSYEAEYRIRTAGGTVWVLETAQPELDESGRVCGLLGTLQDISNRKETEARMLRLAYFDGLTGLPNRESFQHQLRGELRRAERNGQRLAVLFMDLDGFKDINDTMGHEAGDLVLQAAADRLRGVIRSSDEVSRAAPSADLHLARLGGDEFTAMLTHLSDPADALAVAQRIGEKMRTPFIVHDRDLRLTASIGIALYPDDGIDVATLLKHADTAMYHAKERGRDNVQYYSSDLTQRAMNRMDLEHDLRTALEQEQFHLVYQPQMNTRTGRIESVEALIRWAHPQRGPISPADFIPLAERNGLIVPIGERVMRMACEAAAAWAREGLPLRVAVNLSPVQLGDRHLLQAVQDALTHSGLPAERLELEMTETAFMADGAGALDTLRSLRTAGVRLSLDDFGTGFSSMNYLQRMPLHTIKVDRSFVNGLPQEQDSVSIVRAIVSLAKSLGLEVTAEGVETAEQARLLTEMQCEYLQGWLIARPVSAAEIPATLARIHTAWRA